MPREKNNARKKNVRKGLYSKKMVYRNRFRQIEKRKKKIKIKKTDRKKNDAARAKCQRIEKRNGRGRVNGTNVYEYICMLITQNDVRQTRKHVHLYIFSDIDMVAYFSIESKIETNTWKWKQCHVMYINNNILVNAFDIMKFFSSSLFKTAS